MAVGQRDVIRRAVPLNERLFRLEGGENVPVLLGAKCPSCGHCFFPSRVLCASCGLAGLEPVALSGTGRVWTYTVAHQAPPGAIVQPPYVIAQVELPERVLVHSLVTGCAAEDVRIGMDVEIAPIKVREDDEGRDVMAFAFRPLSRHHEAEG